LHRVVAERLAEIPQDLPQGVASLVGRQVGPEEVEEMFAGRGAAGGAGEVDEEGERFSRADTLPSVREL
jgi:hypothetical protein